MSGLRNPAVIGHFGRAKRVRLLSPRALLALLGASRRRRAGPGGVDLFPDGYPSSSGGYSDASGTATGSWRLLCIPSS